MGPTCVCACTPCSPPASPAACGRWPERRRGWRRRRRPWGSRTGWCSWRPRAPCPPAAGRGRGGGGVSRWLGAGRGQGRGEGMQHNVWRLAGSVGMGTLMASGGGQLQREPPLPSWRHAVPVGARGAALCAVLWAGAAAQGGVAGQSWWTHLGARLGRAGVDVASDVGAGLAAHGQGCGLRGRGHGRGGLVHHSLVHLQGRGRRTGQAGE